MTFVSESIVVVCCPLEADLKNAKFTGEKSTEPWTCSLYRTFIYSEQMAIRCSHCKHTTFQSLQPSHAHTQTRAHALIRFIQSVAERHVAHSWPLKYSQTVAAEQRRHQFGIRQKKKRNSSTFSFVKREK